MDRVDFLLYAHDGRGVGHASRIAAIASALRRVNSHYKIVCVTGCSVFSSLLAVESVDWIKLPSYKSSIVDGYIEEGSGSSGLRQKDITNVRKKILRRIVEVFDPRIILVDHCPSGKHGELKEALSICRANRKYLNVFGLRGIIGIENSEVYNEILSKKAIEYLASIYDDIIIYTDKNVFDACSIYPQLKLPGLPILHSGYVSRAMEWELTGTITNDSRLAVDVLVGLGGSTGSINLLTKLANIKKKQRPHSEYWKIFIGPGISRHNYNLLTNEFKEIPSFEFSQFSDKYICQLSSARAFIGHGGYNSITDALWTKVPSFFIARDVPEKDQELHLNILLNKGFKAWVINEFDFRERRLNYFLNSVMAGDLKYKLVENEIALNGSEIVAKHLLSLLSEII